MNFANSILTARLSAPFLSLAFPDLEGVRSEDIVCLAAKLQVHNCSNKCAMDKTTDGCKDHFPRLPTQRTLIASPPDPGMDEEAANYLISQCISVKMAVRSVLNKLKKEGRLDTVSLEDVLLEALVRQRLGKRL